MAVPTLELAAAGPEAVDADVLVIGVRKTAEGPVPASEVAGVRTTDLESIGFAAAAEDVRRIPRAVGAARSLAVVGLGAEPVTAATLRRAAGAVARRLRGVGTIVVDLPWSNPGEAAAILEGAGLGAYAFAGHKSAPDPRSAAASRIVLPGAGELPAAVAKRAAIAVEAVALVRDLVNAPPSDLYPETLAARAVEAVAAAKGRSALPITAEVLDVPALERGGYGGILAVGRGSARPPRLVVVDYRPRRAARHLALVGKGITFDSGGLSIKPASGMVGMKYDMTGAATVLAATVAAARLRLPVRVTAWLCIAENMPSGEAIRPNDVITIKGGTTVEVLNTDAEGRLVLADGLVAASEATPDAMVDVATLTGAVRAAFGTRITAAMGDPDLTERIVRLAADAGETFWPVPIGEEFLPLLSSEVADLANVKMNPAGGGMLIAGAFLQEFVGRTGPDADAPRIPWTHLDIAGTANHDGGGWGWTGKGPTGVGVRPLIALAEALAAEDR